MITHETLSTERERRTMAAGWLVMVVFLGWADTRLPGWPGFLLDWVAILAASFATAFWKRSPSAKMAFLAMAGVFPLLAILRLAGVVRPGWSATSVLFAMAVTAIWVWLIASPHHRVSRATESLPAKREEIHVIHHYPDERPELDPSYTWRNIPEAGARPSLRYVLRELGKPEDHK